MKYYIYIIYEDGSEYEGIITNKDDFNKIPKDKKYETVRIFYDEKYSHIIYGHDYIYLGYKKGILEYAAWTNKIIHIIQLKGVNKEKFIKPRILNRIKPVLIGKQLDDDVYERLRLKCHNYKVDSNWL